MISYYEKLMNEALDKAEMKAANGDDRAAIYALADAVRDVMQCVKELQEKADVA